MPDLPDDDEIVGASAEHDEIVAKLTELIALRGVLHFPEGNQKRFSLKSGRQSSYFLDVAGLCLGHDMFELGRILGVTLRHHFGDEIDVLIAPGYSGIPSTVTATHYYALLTGHQVEWAYLRTPDIHAMRPDLAGAVLNEFKRVVIVDDLLTTGASLREAITTVKQTGAKLVGACVLVDRKERLKGNKLASSEIKRDTGIQVVSCAGIDEIVRGLPESVLTTERRESMFKGA